jgi:Tfp pilus assembly protein PilF
LEGLHGRLTDLRGRLAAVLITAKEYRTAETQLSSWLDSTRNPAERYQYLRRLALCYQLQGNDSRATETLSRALLLKPDEVGLNNDVAYGWIDRGIRLAEAEPMIRYALSREPRQGAYLDTYGWLLYKRGVFAEARKWLLRAGGALADPDPVILDHLGDTCWQLRESEKAVEYWTAAVELLRERSEEELLSEDQRRVRLVTPKKIDDARAGRPPAVAPLAAEPSEGDGSEEAGVPDS